jgi:hypothetical protein
MIACLPAAARAIQVEAEDCTITSWNLSPAGAVVQIVVPPTQSGIDAVEIVGGTSAAVGVGQLRLPGTIPNGAYAITLRYFTNRTYAGSEISVQFGSNSGSVVAHGANAAWHTFYPDDVNASWYTWYDLELTQTGCPFPTSPAETMPTAVSISNVGEGDFYINIWDKTASSFDLATVDYINLTLVPAKTPDMNSDGNVDQLDLQFLSEYFLSDNWSADVAPGDYGDGVVNNKDFSALAGNWMLSAIHVADIATLAPEVGCNPGSWSAGFVVTVEDRDTAPVAGVDVTADWSGVHGAEGTTTETTDGSGQALFDGRCLPIAGSTTLSITNLGKLNHVYAPEENIESSDTVAHVVPWTPQVRAEDWLVEPVFGNYARIGTPGSGIIRMCTDAAGNAAHALGEMTFRFPGTVPEGDYALTVHWMSGSMGIFSAFANQWVGTPWAWQLGADSVAVSENGATITTEDKWHYFYPGHNVAAAAHSNQWYTHDMSGPLPVDFSMWPNSSVSTSFAVTSAGGQVIPDPQGQSIYVSFDQRVMPGLEYPSQPSGFQDTPMVTLAGESRAGLAEPFKIYTAQLDPPNPTFGEFWQHTGTGTTTFDSSLPAGDYIVHASWGEGSWNNGSWFGVQFSGPGVTEHGSDDNGGMHLIYPPTTLVGESVHNGEFVGPSMGNGSTTLTGGSNPSGYPTGSSFGGSYFGTYLTLDPGNRVIFTVTENDNSNYARVFFYGLTFVPAIVSGSSDPNSQGDFYIKLRDMSPAENNYFDIEYFEITPIP